MSFWHNLFRNASSRWILRDPIERYVSAFYSKVACCSGTSIPCLDDATRSQKRIRTLLELAGLPHQGDKCLTLSRFVQCLYVVNAQGRGSLLDAHFRPQQLECGDIRKHSARMIIGNISTVAPVLKSFGNFWVQSADVELGHLHSFGYSKTGQGNFVTYKYSFISFVHTWHLKFLLS